MSSDKFYAQRSEDQTLAKLLGPGYKDRPGFYIDVGAWEPTTDSVTKHFYDLGFCGINVEPVPYYFDLLVKERPRDANLSCALGAKTEVRDFYYVAGTGLSTLDEKLAINARDSQNRRMVALQVPVLTLKGVCEVYAPLDKQIDFLKIDVEGGERDVILGGDWERYRPKFLCIEATVPMTEIPSWGEWEPIVLSNNYKFLLYDGLNRFYQAKETI